MVKDFQCNEKSHWNIKILNNGDNFKSCYCFIIFISLRLTISFCIVVISSIELLYKNHRKNCSETKCFAERHVQRFILSLSTNSKKSLSLLNVNELYEYRAFIRVCFLKFFFNKIQISSEKVPFQKKTFLPFFFNFPL